MRVTINDNIVVDKAGVHVGERIIPCAEFVAQVDNARVALELPCVNAVITDDMTVCDATVELFDGEVVLEDREARLIVAAARLLQ